jgi:hypothetical protein
MNRVSTFNEIKALILEAYPDFADYDYAEICHAIADSLDPTYYHRITETWDTLAMEDRNRWMDFGYENGQTIFNLMQVDIYQYHFDLAHAVFKSLKKETN